MDQFNYRDQFNYSEGHAYCEGVPLSKIAEQVGTPTYVYSRAMLREHCRQLIEAFAFYPTLACFAVKANSNLSVLREIFASGLGADLVSLGELERALLAGVSPEKIVFSGVGKRDDEIERALSIGISSFNVESTYEVENIARIAARQGSRARISLRINPDIDAKTNAKIATGLYTTKFGLAEADLNHILVRLRELPSLELVGVACHIGSQITELGPISEAAQRMAKVAAQVRAAGFPLRFVNMGGGLGIRYRDETPPLMREYASALVNAIKPTGLNLVIEPGRVLAGNIGVLLTRTIGVKHTPARHFVVVDAAMNDLIRPSLYEAFHDIQPVVAHKEGQPDVLCDFVGPICETGDYLGRERRAPLPLSGDLFMIRSCGAYGSSMSSQYNSRPRAAEVMVDGEAFTVVKPRETLESLWQGELEASKHW